MGDGRDGVLEGWPRENEKNTYPQLDEKLYKEDVASCCFYLCSMHIKVFFVHWLVHCHGST